MTDSKEAKTKEGASGNQSPTTKSALPPEEEALNRISNLEQSITKISGEIKSIKGQIDNNNPAELAELQAQNNLLQGRLERLQKALYLLLIESFIRRQGDDMKQKCEVLRLSAVEYFKNANVNKEIWKNIES